MDNLKLIEDVKLGSGKDSIREVWFEYDGKVGSILLRGSKCHKCRIKRILQKVEDLIKKRKIC